MADPEIPEHLSEMWIALSSSIGIIAGTQALTLTGLVQRMSTSGMSKEVIKETLLRDLREGGQIFGDFRKQFKSNMKWGIEEIARREFEQGLDKVDGMWEWLGISDKKICDDCEARNKKSPQKWIEWESEGLPGTGITICGSNCRCRMVIVESIEKPKGGIVVNS
jgi:hypothetical protein